ncbi:Multidrug resistance protein MdtA [Tepidimonas thermarum]|uniref:Multidrug resistance protein MdtA n=1 Tax=Tepidimonas thermarum TaxID=335431 RepID=A0A554WZ47_9BURK|nr:efflux RND transporter periplasmic adaptor subunit [Tepidimonas thermarum]TSE28835.1 Multidrug resistance protein MdtA [Tepidimonas thermarum]
MGRRMRWAVAAVAVGLAAGAAVWVMRPARVGVIVLAEQPVQTSVVASGRVASARETTLASTVTARVVATPVAAGTAVSRGTVLVALEADEWQAALAQAEAQRRDAAEQAAEAQRQWQRQTELHAHGFVSAAALDAAARTRDAAQRRLEQADAAVQQAWARRALAAVRALDDGVLLERLVEVGDGVTPGKPLARFAVAGPPRILLDLDERDLAALAVGQTAAVRADAWPDQPVPARVQRIAAQVDHTRGTVEVELTPTAPAAHWLPGMTVSAEIVTGAARARVLLPVTAVRNGQVATVVEGRVRWQAVQTEPARGRWLPVREGVTAGAVVIDPAPALDDGARVEVRP